MEIHTDFQSNIIILVFDSGREEKLTKDETKEFNERMYQVQIDARKNQKNLLHSSRQHVQRL